MTVLRRATRPSAVALAGACALLISLAVAAPGAHAGGFHGVVTQNAVSTQDFERMGSGGVGTLRLRVSWDRIQATKDGPYEWSWLDDVVGGAAAEGVRVIPVLDGNSPRGLPTPPTTGEARRGYARFAGALARRYGNGGEYWEPPLVGEPPLIGEPPPTLPITTYQLYNEQNGRAYWGAKPSASDYGKLVKAASRKIRAESPGAEVVLGGMFATPSGRGSIKSWKYLSRLYRMRGIKAAFDTVAVHPYAPNLELIQFQVKKIRKVMKANGDRRAALRITEFGWGSAKRGGPLNKGKKGQARMLKKAFRLFDRKRGAWKIAGVNWFAWRDERSAACYFCPSAGLFTQGRRAKPAWGAFKRVAR